MASRTPGEIRERLLAVNRPTALFQVIDGRDEGVDLIAEWKIVDARWYEILAKAGREKVFLVDLKFDEDPREVRSNDHEYTLSWSADVPRPEVSSSRTWGHTQSVQFGTAYAFTEELRPGQAYSYRFSTGGTEAADPGRCHGVRLDLQRHCLRPTVVSHPP